MMVKAGRRMTGGICVNRSENSLTRRIFVRSFLSAFYNL